MVLQSGSRACLSAAVHEIQAELRPGGPKLEIRVMERAQKVPRFVVRVLRVVLRFVWVVELYAILPELAGDVNPVVGWKISCVAGVDLYSERDCPGQCRCCCCPFRVGGRRIELDVQGEAGLPWQLPRRQDDVNSI
jgi:hypothetical protein